MSVLYFRLTRWLVWSLALHLINFTKFNKMVITHAPSNCGQTSENCLFLTQNSLHHRQNSPSDPILACLPLNRNSSQFASFKKAFFHWSHDLHKSGTYSSSTFSSVLPYGDLHGLINPKID